MTIEVEDLQTEPAGSLAEAIAEAFAELEPGDVVTVHDLDPDGEPCAIDDDHACTCGKPYAIVVPPRTAA